MCGGNIGSCVTIFYLSSGTEKAMCTSFRYSTVYDLTKAELFKAICTQNPLNIDHTHLIPQIYAPVIFFFFPRLKRMLSGKGYNSIKPLGSAVNQWLNSIPRADYFAAFWYGYRDLKSIFLLKENILKEWNENFDYILFMYHFIALGSELRSSLILDLACPPFCHSFIFSVIPS